LKLLLVEDDAGLAEGLRPVLRDAGYVVEWADNGVDAEFLAREEDFDGLILDLGLPGKSGLELLRSLRAQSCTTPVLILTARDGWQERVDGLKAGADDYLGKPFHSEELLARLEAILRRRHGLSSNRIEQGGLVLDLDRQWAQAEEREPVQLTGIEFRLLRHLMLNPHKIVSKTELSEHVYEEEQLKDSNVIEVYVNRLRKRFGKAVIETFRGQGYRLGRLTPD
jgi:DNA-binding response OmpR family regulator